MHSNTPVLMKDFLAPAPLKGGRPKGSGCNQLLLDKLVPGEAGSCIFGCSPDRAKSLRVSAARLKYKLKLRKLTDGAFAIWRLT